jgi:peptidoglycan/xylan/chitin deacetylase (PgdA/CDA1 family)
MIDQPHARQPWSVIRDGPIGATFAPSSPSAAAGSCARTCSTSTGPIRAPTSLPTCGRRLSLPATAHDPFDLSLPPELFEQHLEVVAEQRTIVELREMLTVSPENLPEHPVALTFDDGYSRHLSHVLPVLERLSLPATFFLTSQSDEVRQGEMADCCRALEAVIGRPVALFAYPYGGVDEPTARLAREHFESALDCTPERITGSFDVARVPRLDVKRWAREEFADRLDALFAPAAREARVSFLP